MMERYFNISAGTAIKKAEVDKRRLGKEIGKLHNNKLQELEAAILIHLNISI